MILNKLVGVIAAVLCALLAAPGSATADGYITLTVDCLKQNNDGSYTATFGYQNYYRDDGYLTIVSPIGEKNMFTTGAANRGQPSTFSYGRYPGQFSITWDGTPLTWQVKHVVRGNEYTSSITTDTQNVEQTACKIIPYADCIMRDYGRRDNGNWYEHYYTYYSYYNPGAQIEIPQGSSNAVGHYCYYNGCSPDLDQNQPTTFLPGHHRGAFRVSSLSPGQYGNTSDIYWFLGQGESDYTYAISQWSYTRECNLFPISECLQTGCQVPGQKGTKTAWFGYDNKEPFEIETPVRNYYNSLRPSYGCEYNNYSGYDQFGRPCIYPQPIAFQTGRHKKVFGVCFSGNYNNGEEGGSGENLPIEEIGLNNYGYVRWTLGTGWYEYGNSHYASITSLSKQCNRAPTCNAGNYTLPCAGETTNLFLHGWLSGDPDGDALAYNWSHSCTDATLYGANESSAVISFATNNDSSAVTCGVQLTVKEQGTEEGFSTTCSGIINVLACTLDNNGCMTRDLSSTEYMLAAAADEQRKLVDRGVAFLRKVKNNTFNYKRIINLANYYNTKMRTFAWALPDSVYECTTATNCAGQSLASTSSGFDTNSKKLDGIIKQLVAQLNQAGQRSWAARYDRSRKILRSNIVRLVETLPKQTNVCK